MRWEFKNPEEIKKFIKEDRVFVFSCNSCGSDELEEKNKKIESFLKDLGIEILGIINLTPEKCNTYSLKELIKENSINSNTILTFTCGGLPQILPSFLNKKVIPGVNVLKIETGKLLGSFIKLCSACGDCWVHYTGNLCMEKLCPKKMRNGPCGGAKDGYCEVYEKRLCPFVILYRKGERESFVNIIPPKDFSKILLQE